MGQSGSTGNGLCVTPACVNAASYVVQNLASNWESLDPCTNFYQMACGGVVERWDDSTSATGFMQARINRILRKVVEEGEVGCRILRGSCFPVDLLVYGPDRPVRR